MKDKPYMMLKFGDIKYADFTGSPEASKIHDTLNSINDRNEYHSKVLEIIDLFNGEFILWWGSEKVNKEQAKKYVNNYPTVGYWDNKVVEL